MKRTVFVASLLAWSATVHAHAAAATGTVTVFAAASLREAFEAAAPAFTKKTNVAVTFDFGGSDALEQQIAQGAPADVFASANETQMKKAGDGGLLASTPKTFVRNRLVAIVPKDNRAHVAAIADLAKPGVKVVLAAPTVPIGNYARATLKRLDGQTGFANDFDSAVEKNVVSNELDVKAVATKISLGEGDVGIVYVTDVTPSLAASVSELTFPSGVVPDIAYPIAALKGAANASGARAFVDFILSDGQAYLKARGFLAP
ncbi:MAG: molybdate ABC transporter substrate-binding protein [Candidatus Eremiobacteraeota bacterium]|nr:molybdate ABC transporter substrate-binding protein [Candidatus Eremiobacteraeota bacterium]